LFASGQYLALTVEGPACEHLVAFARLPDMAPVQNVSGVSGDEAVLVVVPRLTASLGSAPATAPLGDAVWADTSIVLPEQLRDRDWRCELTREPVAVGPDGSLAAAQVLRSLPVALLVGRK